MSQEPGKKPGPEFRAQSRVTSVWAGSAAGSRRGLHGALKGTQNLKGARGPGENWGGGRKGRHRVTGLGSGTQRWERWVSAGKRVGQAVEG